MEVTLPDGTSWYGESNDTVDRLMPLLFANVEDRDAHWREHDWSKWCCGLDASCVIETAVELERQIEHEVCLTHRCFVALGAEEDD